MNTGFWWGNWRERDHLEEPSMDGMIILRWIFQKWDVGLWTGFELAQDRDRCWELVIVVMNLRVSYNAENRLASKEGLCCME